MNKYENEQSILRDDPCLETLCKSYKQAVRVHATSTAHAIRTNVMRLYKFDSRRFSLFVKASHSMVVSRRSKLKRLESHIRDFYEIGDCHFITLTWNDDALISNSSATRKRFVRTTLNNVAQDFVANIDFGKINHREHYHGVTLNLDIDALRSIWKPFGYIKVERVIPSTECSLSLYVDKLCNHALKETTCKTLMYCRKKDRPCRPPVSLWTFTKSELVKAQRKAYKK